MNPDICGDVPLIAVTAFAMVGDRDKVIAIGFDGYITKPITPETFVAEVESYLQPRGGPVAIILVVDDLTANREFLVTLLRYQGHRLLEAANGREALAVVQQECRLDPTVITDVLMPVMDGYEFVRQLRLDPAGCPGAGGVLHGALWRTRRPGTRTGDRRCPGSWSSRRSLLTNCCRVVSAALAGKAEHGEWPDPERTCRSTCSAITASASSPTSWPRVPKRPADREHPAASADQYRVGAGVRARLAPSCSNTCVLLGPRALPGATYTTLGILGSHPDEDAAAHPDARHHRHRMDWRRRSCRRDSWPPSSPRGVPCTG